MDHIDAYRKLRPIYESLSQRVQHLLQDVAKTNGIDVHAIEARAKTVDGFAEKLARPGKAYENPLEEVTDLCGLRVILYYQEDVDRFSKAVRDEFIVDDKRSVDKRNELRFDQFGYISVHLICQLHANRTGLLEWRNYKNLTMEIQVRTVLQHAWASISHALQYKSKADIPDQFVRQLTRIAGLLELSDEQFSDLRERTAALRVEIDRSLANSDLNVTVNSVALEQFIASSPLVAEIEEAARNIGFSVHDEYTSEQLATVCQGLNVTTLSELNGLLELFIPRAPKFFQYFSKLEAKGGMEAKDIRGDRDHWSAVAVVAMNHKTDGTAFVADDEIWGENYLKNVLRAAKQARI